MVIVEILVHWQRKRQEVREVSFISDSSSYSDSWQTAMHGIFLCSNDVLLGVSCDEFELTDCLNSTIKWLLHCIVHYSECEWIIQTAINLEVT